MRCYTFIDTFPKGSVLLQPQTPALHSGAVLAHHWVFRQSLLAVSVLEVVQAVKEVLWGGGPGQGRQRGGPQERL